MARSHLNQEVASRVARPPRRALGPTLARNTDLLLFLAPACTVMGFLFGYPLLYNAYISTIDWSLRKRSAPFVGLDNYIFTLQNPEFWNAAWVTLLWTFGSVFCQFVIGFGLALILREDVPGRGILRMLLFLPWVSPPTVTGIIFRWLYNPQLGVMNYALLRFGVIDNYIAWLSEPGTALVAVTIANIWQGYAFTMMTMLSALTAVPRELEESALIDGANYVQRLRSVVIPSILPVIITTTLLGFIWTTNSFTMIYVLTEGGPLGRTTIFPILIYETAFSKLYFSRASAISIIVFAFVSVLSVFYLRLLRRRAEI